MRRFAFVIFHHSKSTECLDFHLQGQSVPYLHDGHARDVDLRDQPRARLDLEFEIPKAGNFDVEAHFTTARDYAIINVLLDSKALGEPLDLFDHPDVRTTGVLKLGQRTLKAGKHKLTLETIGTNESAVKKYMVGLDYLRLVPR